MKKISLLLMFVAVVFILAVPCVSKATEMKTAEFYKDKIVTILVTAPPGSTNDIFARLTADFLGKLTGARIGVENKPAAGGTVAQNSFYQIIEPDGLTLMLDATGRIWPGYLMGEEQIKYDSSKFEYISGASGGPYILGVSPKSSYKKIDDLKTTKDLKVPSSSPTSILTFAAIAVSESLSLDAKVVVGLNSKAAYLALQQGEADFMVRTYDSVVQYEKQGAFKPLAQIGDERDPLCPDLPTIGEIATLSNYQNKLLSVFFTEAKVFVAPPGTPKDRVKFWDDCISEVLNNSEFQKKMTETIGVWFGIYPAEKAQKDLKRLIGNKENFKLYAPLLKKYVK